MNGPTELSPQECRDRLAEGVFGRLAFSTPEGIGIVPLNYVLRDDLLAVRTTPYSEVARSAVGTVAAFEVDDIDPGRHSGWSVVVTGMLEQADADDLADLFGPLPQPWAGGVRNLHLVMRVRGISGRRLPEPSP
jgi:nitroimidazol reductase NimA-like FMN-containing flavoprotein (pyridoxamine 5'-phosphate oxidase superfamily)